VTVDCAVDELARLGFTCRRGIQGHMHRTVVMQRREHAGAAR
jgi:hypothetical protein